MAAVIALNLTVAGVTISARRDGRPGQRVAAGLVEAPSPLSAGRFDNRRTVATAASATTTASAGVEPAPTTTTALRPTSTSVTVPRAVTPTTRRGRIRSSTTTTRIASAAPGPETARNPARARSAVPKTTASGPAAVPKTAPPTRLTDPAGDTFVADTDAPLAEPRADVVEAAASYGPNDIVFTLHAAQPADPLTDKGWSSKKTTVVWSVDTNGDMLPDYDVRYLVVADEMSGERGLTGFVTWLGPDRKPPCPLAASYDADGYKALVKPGCLGDPASFTFRASIDYQAKKGAEVAGDVAPDKGFSPAVSR